MPRALGAQIYAGRKYTFTRKRFFAALRGRTLHEAARELGCSYSTLIYAFGKFKARRRGGRGRVPLPPIPREELEPYIRGYSWEQLAETFGRSITFLRRSFKLAKLVKRDERTRNSFNPCRTR